MIFSAPAEIACEKLRLVFQKFVHLPSIPAHVQLDFARVTLTGCMYEKTIMLHLFFFKWPLQVFDYFGCNFIQCILFFEF